MGIEMEAGAAHRVTFLVSRSVLAWKRSLRRILAPFGLTPARFYVLEAVVRMGRAQGRGASQAQIGRALDMDRKTVKRVVDALAREELVARAWDGGMQWEIEATKLGGTVLTQVGILIDGLSEPLLDECGELCDPKRRIAAPEGTGLAFSTSYRDRRAPSDRMGAT